MEPLSIMRTVVDTRAVFVPPPLGSVVTPLAGVGRGAPVLQSHTTTAHLAGPGKHYYTTIDGLSKAWDQCRGVTTLCADDCMMAYFNILS